MGTFLRAVTNVAVFCCVSGFGMLGFGSAYANSSGLKENNIDRNSSNALRAVKRYAPEPSGKIDKKFRMNLSEKSERSMLSDGVVFVRQNQLSIYQADIEIIKSTEPLGSHLFITYQFEGDRTKWVLGLRYQRAYSNRLYG